MVHFFMQCFLCQHLALSPPTQFPQETGDWKQNPTVQWRQKTWLQHFWAMDAWEQLMLLVESVILLISYRRTLGETLCLHKNSVPQFPSQTGVINEL
jgi:hypothetical protein